MKLCWFTELLLLINWITDECPSEDLTFDEIHDAAADGRFIALLAEHYGQIAEFAPLLKSSSVNVEQMEAALSDAAAVLEGREAEKVCVENSGLCLATAVVVQAIKQQFEREGEDGGDGKNGSDARNGRAKTPKTKHQTPGRTANTKHQAPKWEIPNTSGQ